MNQTKKWANIILIPIILAIFASTAWSVYKSSKTKPPQNKTQTTSSTQDFFKRLYRERLIEEGNRTKKVEQLIKEGKLSDEPARYVKEKGK